MVAIRGQKLAPLAIIPEGLKESPNRSPSPAYYLPSVAHVATSAHRIGSANLESLRDDLSPRSRCFRGTLGLVGSLETGDAEDRWPPVTSESLVAGFQLRGNTSSSSSIGSPERPTTRGTMNLAKLRATEIMHGQIWRGPSLELDLSQNLQDDLEFAQYRFECMREASLASREKARKWKLLANARKARKEQEETQSVPQSTKPEQPAQSPAAGGWPRRLRKSLGILPADAKGIRTPLLQKASQMAASQMDTQISSHEAPPLPDIVPRLLGSGEAEDAQLRASLTPQRRFRKDSSRDKDKDNDRQTERTAGKPGSFKGPKPGSFLSAIASWRGEASKGVRFEDENQKPGSRGSDRSSAVARGLSKDNTTLREEQAAKKKALGHLNAFKQKLKQDKPTILAQKRQKEWARISETEKEVMRNAFASHLHKGNTGLDAVHLRMSLRDLGLGGRNKEEKQEMWNLCQEYIGIHAEVDFHSFCHEVVPSVRTRFRDMHRNKVHEAFHAAAGKDKMVTEQSGQAMVESILGTPLMSVEAVQELRSCFQEELKEEERMRNSQRDEKIEHNPALHRVSLSGQTQSAWGPRSSFLEQWESKATKKIAFAQFEIIMQRTAEVYERLQLHRLKKIQRELAADEKTIREMEGDIVPLHISFKRFDADDSGELDQQEIRSLLQEFGFLSGDQQQDTDVLNMLAEATASETAAKIELDDMVKNSGRAEAILVDPDSEEDEQAEAEAEDENSGEGAFDFKACLKLVYEVREEMKRKRREETRKLFHRIDRDRSGQLSMLEMSTLFEEMGLTPRCHRGQEEIKRLLANCDTDGTGELDFEEFEQLVQLVTEKLRSITRFREMELGIKLGFTEKQVREYRDCFWDLDKDGSGHLDLQELRTLMRILRQRIDGDEIRLLMRTVDKDGDGHVDFSEFLQLVHSLTSMSDEKSPQGSKQPVASPAAGPDSPVENLQNSIQSDSQPPASSRSAVVATDGVRPKRRMSRMAANLAKAKSASE